MGLVDHDELVLGQQRAVHREVHAVEVRVHDDDVGGLALRACRLGEALLAHGAAERAGALVPSDAHRRPCRGARLERELGAIAGLGVLGPCHEPADLVADRGRCGVDTEIELPVLAGLHLRDPLAAHVVRASLQHRPRELAAEVSVEERAGPSSRAGPATPSSPWRRRSCGPTRSRGRGTPASCRCRCRPARRDVGAVSIAALTASAISRWPSRRSPPPGIASTTRSRSGPTAATLERR